MLFSKSALFFSTDIISYQLHELIVVLYNYSYIILTAFSLFGIQDYLNAIMFEILLCHIQFRSLMYGIIDDEEEINFQDALMQVTSLLPSAIYRR